MLKTIRIGNGAGFWGDNLDAPILLTDKGGLDYLTLEYLAELTMSLLAHQRERDPRAGYVTDFPPTLRRLVPFLREQPRLRVVTNAGGMNPDACAREAARVLAAGGMGEARVGVVSGDDLAPRLARLVADGEAFAHLDTGAPLAPLLDRVASANAYLGARPIADALAGGARVVVTGRVADASLTVGPAVHAWGWRWDDWDRLAGASVAGHLIECGAQVTGGLWTRWRDCPDLATVGYPIAVVGEEGDFEIAKPEGTGGAVNRETVIEQLVYEIGDPRHYLTPDVDADFTSVAVEETGPDRVRVRGARGGPAPERLKVSIAYRGGFAASGTLVVFGPDAAEKARRCGQMVLERVRRAGFEFEASHVEALGAGACVPGAPPPPADAREVVLRVGVRDPRREAVERFCRELAPLVTSGPPGVTGYTGERPRPREVLAYWPALVSRERVKAEVEVQSAAEWAGGASS